MDSQEKLFDYLKRASAELQETRTRLHRLEAAEQEPIAIVGLGCRFAGGARDPESFWDLVASGTDAVGGFPNDRGWDAYRKLDLGEASTSFAHQGGFVHDAAQFDPGLFGISPREALAMDPQQRMILEVAWESLERSRIEPRSLRGSSTGVFVGAGFAGYGEGLVEADTGAEGYLVTGSQTAMISGRVAYTLGLEGPAVTVDTACSSALVAVHLAAQALRTGDCTMALAGGVVVMVTPGAFAEFAKQQGLAADGRCKAFAGAADGMGWGEGAGLLVLERLSDARRNGHPVLALIAGSAVNQDGASNGLTAPNGPSQQRVIREALTNARVRADQVDVVEAHGTGTTLGDPIEAQAILATYGRDRPQGAPLWLGSVKSNIGHTQAAAGVASVIKMVLAMQNELLPRTLHVDVPTPEVDWSAGDVRLLTEEVPWPASDGSRRAGVSSFGLSGTNVHLILQEAPDAAAPADAEDAPSAGETGGIENRPEQVLSEGTTWLVSSRTAAGLRAQAERLAEFVRDAAVSENLDLTDLGWSLATTRSVFEHRAVVRGGSRDELLSGLAALAADLPAANVVSAGAAAGRNRSRTVFVFPGQGSQWVGMGRSLAESSPVFAARLAECGEALAPYVDWSLDEVIASGEFDRVDVVQPVLWAMMVSLAAVWQAAGVNPDAVVGHSQGEIAAAVVAGILSLEDAAKVVALRSKALIALSGRGGMLSLAESVAAVERRIEPWADRVSVAAVNGPEATVVSGTPDALEEIRAACESEGVRARILPVDYASHGPQVDELRDEILSLLAGISPQPTRLPMVSALTGGLVQGPELDAEYWYASLRGTVHFSRAIEVLGRSRHGVFIETSAHPVLTASISATLEQPADPDDPEGLSAGPAPVVTGTLRRDEGGPARLLASLAEAHVHGVVVDWSAVLPVGRHIDLPTYAFQHQHFWSDPVVAGASPIVSGDGESEAQARFWAAVENGDTDIVADTLAVDGQRLDDLLPALASWRRRERGDSATRDWRYQVSWVPVPDPASSALHGTWLVVVPAAGIDAKLHTECVAALTAAGAEVLLAEISSVDRDAIVAVLRAALGDEQRTPAGVVSLLALDETRLPQHPAVTGGVAGTLGLVQALGELGIGAPLWVLTAGAVATAPGGPLSSPVQAQVWGLGRVAGLEHPERWGGLIDLPSTLDVRAMGRLAGILADGSEDQTAIRPSGILGRRLVRSEPASRRVRAWKPRGGVLVTGAGGAIGPSLAGWLAETGAAHLTLVSRRGPMVQGAAAVAAQLAAAGTSVSLASCDVTERDAVAGLLAWTERTGPRLTTVIHGAIAVDLLTLADTGIEELARNLGAKAVGADVLDELTADLDLDEFVLFSSIAATWGVTEHGAYAAANAHLDALAENRRARGLPATSVAWGVWDTGQEQNTTDQAVSVIPARLRAQGLRLLDPSRALAALGSVLAGNDTAVPAVADVDWPRFSAVFNAVRSRPLLDGIPEARQVKQSDAANTTALVTSGEAAELLARLVGAKPGQRERIMTGLVRAHAAAVLGHPSTDAVEADRAFRDLGFDSLTAVELRGRLNQATGLQLPSTVVFDYPSPLVLAQRILTQLLGSTQLDSARRANASDRSGRAPLSGDPIALVGIGCRFPGGANSPEALWRLLETGADAIGGFPLDRGWDLDALLDGLPGSTLTSVTREGGFVAGAADFDPGFFRISPREALAMDPQQRLLLETSWEALEHAGLDPVSLRGSATGVFAGAAASGYAEQPGFTEDAVGHLLTGNITSVISGRISYTLGLEGPAVTVDTACSASLVSLHLAAQALRAGECDLALAGGVIVITSPGEFIGFSQQGALAADGRCKAFSADADGMGLSEGAGMVVLERLSDARRNGHPVLAVIAGSAVNQDGASNGLSAPNGPSQQRVIRAALASAGLEPGDVDAVEAHGTGTRLGDPIEAQAILATYGQDRPEGHPLRLGSVKSNLGHAQQAAGIAGVIKMVLALQHGVLPATLHAQTPSPHVDWSVGDVRLLTEAENWPANGRPRRAGVSAFGISGTNAHLILEEPPAEAKPDIEPGDASSPVLAEGAAWLISAQTADALREQASRLADHVSSHPESNPIDVAWSLATTRSVFEHRAVVTGADRDELIAGLGSLASGVSSAGVVSGAAIAASPVVFVFPGQGSQWVGMGCELAAVSPVFAARLAECGVALAPYVDWSLEEVLASGDFERVDVVQPVLWAVMVSLAAVWEAAGVIPDAVLGHSQGEIAAAVVAGALTLEDAAKVVALRSRALIALSGRGGMLSIAESADAVRNRIAGDRVAVAAVNGPSATVVSGDSEVLQQLLAACEGEGVRARMLPVDYASHGPQVEELRDEILSLLTGLAPREAVIPMVSALTGEYIQGPELDAEYWYASLRGTVEFSRATEVLGRAGYRVFVETSAHPVLTSAISDTLDEQAPVVTGTLRRDEGGPARLLTSLAEAHVRGVAVDWAAVLPQGKRVSLPTYAFQRQRYWPKAVARASRRSEIDIADWRYRISWSAPTEPEPATLTDAWLLVALAGSSQETLVADCRAALADHGADVVLVEMPADELDRDLLRQRITRAVEELGDAVPLSGVVSLLALDDASVTDSPVVSRGFAATVALAQALDDAELTSARLWVLTCGAVSVGDVPHHPLQAQTWAFARVAALESPERWGGLIDLPPTWDARTADRLVAVLAGCGEDQVAIRSEGVLGRRLVRASRPTQAAAEWRPTGTVLVTGGTGGVGGHVARWLATSRDARQIVLSNRSGPAASGAATLAADLAAAGSDVAVLAGDVGDRAQAAGLLGWIDAHGPAISSIMHAAGTAPSVPVELLTSADLTAVFDAKVGGAVHLDALTADRELDAFVVFSSGAAAWGSARLSAYAAANAALDALIEERRARGLSGTSVAWGLWGGGGLGEGAAGEMLQRAGVRVMEAALAVRSLAGILDAREDLVVVSDMDWSRFATVFTVQRPSPLLADLTDAQQAPAEAASSTEESPEAGSALSQRLRGLSEADQDRLLTDLVRADAAAVLGHATPDAVPATRAFKDLGFDSLTAVDLRTRLNTATGLKLPATLVFDYPTPAAVVRLLRTELLGTQAQTGSVTPSQTGRAVDHGEPIAIVGMACRLPGGVHAPEELWELLVAGTDAISSFPTDRGWDPDGVFAGMASDAATALVGGFIYDAAHFDAGFFGISPREAVTMDPQQRLLLETAWEAVERAGISPASLAGSATGVFAGAGFGGYGAGLSEEDGTEGYLLIGGLGSVISGRVSYTLGLEGPAVTVDTACSSSLVALHLAAQALRTGECSMALAGGVAVMSSPGAFSEFSYQGGFAFDGRCKAFAEGADGIGWGEGAGILVLERLSDAQRNGHRVLAVVRSSAMNQDGASNGLTAPNGPSQQKVIRAALASAGLRADEVDAVEAHGTGTALGDPIEAQAILATYGQDRPSDRPLRLGSVKTNIGHLQTAAGVAGVIKMVLALQHELLPRTLHAEVPSTHVDWSAGAVELLTEPVAWPANGRPRRAGVSAFGVSGTNVHVIIEEAPAPVAVDDERESAALPVLAAAGSTALAWPISARTAAALAAQAARLGEFALAQPSVEPADVTWSLLTSRSVFEHRAVVVGRDRAELLSGLSAVAAGQPSAAVVSGVVPAVGGANRTVFVFPGQGSQWVGMGRELAASSPVFAARLAECGEALAPYVDWSLDEVIASGEFDRVDVVQPVLWAVMVSLAAVWQAAGVNPDAVVGHSQGEIAAAVVAGILSLEDAAKVVALRSKALIALSGRGGMLSLAESVAAVEIRIEPWADRVSVAAVNGPDATVVSGTPDALEEIRAACESEGVRARILPVDYASHGPQVDELREEILSLLAGISPQPTRLPMVSALTGEQVQGPELDAEYWYASLRGTVHFSRAIEEFGRTGYDVFIETSAHPVLTNAISSTLEARSDGPTIVVTGTLRRDDGGAARLLASLAEVHVRGLHVDWTTVVPRADVVELPTYAFQRRRYWPKAATASSAKTATIEAEFWSAVEAGDLDGLSETLAVDGAALGEVLPALASWRARDRDESSKNADWRYRVSWLPLREPAPAVLAGIWLLVSPAGSDAAADLTAACARMLTDRGASVVNVELSATDLDRSALTARLGEALEASGQSTAAVVGVLSLLGIDERPLPDRPVIPVASAATMLLFQALSDAGTTAPLWALTQGAVKTGAADEQPVSPIQAQVWGLGRTAGVEQPGRWGGLIDLPPVLTDRATARLAGILADGSEDQVAIRSGGVVARRLVRANPRRASGGAWSPRGTVLLTGASGAIGPDLAAWLAEAGTQHAVLTGRRGPSTPGAARIAALLAEAGTAITLVSCDVADRAALSNLLQWIPTVAPPLSTVIHAAVAVELTSVDETQLDHLELTLGAKAVGATYLDELTADLDLDEFVMFSSISATWGVGEHGTYAAANAHLDALAEQRRARGLPGTSVAWGVWSSGGKFDDAANEAADRPQSLIPERLKRQGLHLLDPDRALTILSQVLADDETVLSVADVDWPRFSAVFNAARSWRLLDEIPEARQVADEAGSAAAVDSGASSELVARLLAASPAQRERIVTDLVGSHAAVVLGHSSADEVDAARAFRDMGFDSLTAVDLRGRLNQATGLQLPSTVVFDYPSPAMLAQEIVKRLVGASQQPQGTESRVTPVSATDPIVIVGLGCRFPGGVESPETMWDLLANAGDAVGGFPADRGWDIKALANTVGGPGSSVTREGGFVTGAADFDPAFFRISPREALAMDPQQRLLLETSWEALERVGLDPVSLRGSLTGVFAGAAASGYASQPGFDEDSTGHLLTGNVTSVISGRISYTLGLEGPAVTVDTACSSALVALHLAAQALRAGECDLALAGGVMVIADPAEFIGFSKQGALAADGRCKAFSADADGMGLAEGAGMIVLERLSDARRNGHTVLAMVAGSAVNQDGASNGLSAPNGPSQKRVIRAALANAGLNAADVDAVEAHGTGTRLGDPIEAQALLATYGQSRPEGRPLWLGTVKSNIGHAQQAAGAAGIIKMVLALQHGLLPATLHADVPSPHVDWTEGDVRLLTEPVDWKQNGRPRRAGVSAFGISGTNAHLILQEPPIEPEPETVDGGALDLDPLLPHATAWLVSGQTASALADQAGHLADHTVAHPELDPVDVGWSLATTRSVFDHRAVVVGAGTGTDREELTAGLRALVAGSPSPRIVSGEAGGAGPVVFVFPGQGSQWIGMGRELAAASPVFAKRLAECGRALSAYVDWSLDDVLAGAEDAPGFDRVDVVQPVLWAIMVSLAEFWQAAGVTADAVLGHSQGEIAAAVVAGALTLEDAAKVVALRSKALIALSGRGGMLSIAESADVVRGRITDEPRLAIAAVNGPSATVVSGEPEALAELLAACEGEGVRARMLPVDYASHGPQIEELREEILDLLSDLTPRPGLIPMVSALTGEYLQGPELDAEYWYASLRGTVEFSRATEILGDAGYRVFIETSAHPVLTSAISDTLDEIEPVVTGTLRRDEGGPARVLASLAEAHVHGVFVDWTAVLPAGKRVELPTYAFQRQRYWPKPVARVARSSAADIADWRYRITWAPVAEPAAASLSGTWLFVTSAAGAAADRALTASCMEALTDRGAEVVVAEIGPDELDRESLRAHLTRVLDEHVEYGGLPIAGIVSLLALDTTPMDDAPVVARGLAGTVGLIQALGDAEIEAELWALTSGAVAALDGEVPASPVPAQSLAFGRVAALEHPARWGGLIDLPPTWDARTADRLVAVLAGCGEDQVAIRSTGVLGRRLVRAPRPAQAAAQWKPSGSVLITGGTGGVGGHVARWLATSRDARQIVVSSRSGPAASGVAALAAELAAAGSDVAVLAGDVGDRAQTAGLVGWIDTHGPAVSSIMHAAGAGVGGTLSELSPADLTLALQAKAGGATYLDELTSDRELDAFVVFSSGAATWGSARLSGYAAANAALDALVEDRRGRGLSGTSVAWGLWGGGGMGEGPAGEMLQRLGVREMEPEPAVAALAGAMDADEDLIAVSDIDWSRFATIFTVQRPSPLLADLPEARQAIAESAASTEESPESGSALSRRLEGLGRAEQDRFLVELVRAEAAAVLGYATPEAVPPTRAFKDLGFDSLTAVDLRTRLNTATGLKLPATLVFDYPTPTALAEFIRSKAVDEQTDYATALAELKALQAVIARAAWSSEERFDLTSRLDSIGQQLRARAEGEEPGVDRELDAATDDEMFDAVEQELRAADFD